MDFLTTRSKQRWQRALALAILTALFFTPLLVFAASPAPPTNALPETTKRINPTSPDLQAKPAAPAAFWDLQVTKFYQSGSQAGPGSLIVYRIDLQNDGNSTATNVRLTDTLPISLSYESSFTTDEAVTLVQTGTEIVWTIDTLDAIDSVDIYLLARVITAATPGEVLTNVVRVDLDEVDQDPGNNVHTRTTSVRDETRDLSVTKQRYIGTPYPGNTMEYRVTVQNRGNSPLNNVILTDTLPFSVTFVEWDGILENPTYPANTDLDETISIQQVDNQLVWELGRMEGGADAYIYVTVQIDEALSGGDVLTNVAEVSTTDVETVTFGSLNANVYTLTTELITTSVDLDIDSSLDTGNMLTGTNIVYEIDFDNDGELTATNVIITNTLPLSVSLVSWEGYVDQPNRVDLDETITATISGQIISWNVGILPPDENGELRVTAYITTAAELGDVLTNVVEISATEPDRNSTNNIYTQTNTIVARQYDAGINKSGTSEAAPGTLVEYNLNYNTFGANQPVTDFTLTDTFPITMSFEGWDGNYFAPGSLFIDLDENQFAPTVGLTQAVWSLGTLPAETFGTIYVRFRISDTARVGETLKNNVEVSIGETESNTFNNEGGTETTVITGTQDLYIRKTLNGSPPAPGTEYRYEIYFTNQGTEPVATRITETLPANTDFVSWSGYYYPQGDYTELEDVINPTFIDNEIVWDLGQLEAGNNGYIDLTLRADASLAVNQPLTNTTYISIGENETDVDDNDSIQVTIVGTRTRDLRVNKLLGYPYVMGAPGGQFEYVIEARNNGNSPVNNVIITDTLPPSLTLVSWSGSKFPDDKVTYDNYFVDLDRSLRPIITDESIIWDLGQMGGSENAYLYLTMQVDEDAAVGDVLTNVVEISGQENELDLTNNVFTHAETIVTRTFDLDVFVSRVNEVGAPGGLMEFDMDVDNEGNWDAEDIVITQTFEGPLDLLFWEGDLEGVVTPTINGQQLVWQLDRLAWTDDIDFDIFMRVDPTAEVGDSITATIEATSRHPDATPDNNIDTDSRQIITRTQDLDISKNLSQQYPGTPGGLMEYRIYVENDGNWPAEGIVITDTLPTGLSLVEWYGNAYQPTSTTSIDLDEQISVNQNGQTLSWNLPVALMGDGYASIYITTRLTDTLVVGNYLNNQVSVSTTSPDVDQSNNEDAYASRIFSRTFDIEPRKNLEAGTIAPGEQVEYELYVENDGNWDAEGLVITDTLGPGLTYIASRDSNSQPLNPDINGQQVVWQLNETLAADSSTRIFVTVQLDPGLQTGTEIYNQIDVDIAGLDARPQNNRDIFVSTVLTPTGPVSPTWNVSLNKSLVSGTPQPGQELTYRLSYANTGNQPASNLSITDVLPPDLTYVSDNPGSFTTVQTGSTTTWQLASLSVGANGHIDLTVRVANGVADGTNLVNQASIGIDETETTLADNNPVITTTVAVPFIDLALSKQGTASGLAGSTVTYTLSVVNNGNVAATNLVITDTLPSGLSYRSDDAPGFSTVLTGGTIVWTRSVLAVGETATLTLSTDIDGGIADNSTLVNQAIAAATENEPNQANNGAAFTTTVAAPVVTLSIGKSGPAASLSGSLITYTLRVVNNGNVVATDLVITDALPSGANYVSGGTLNGQEVSWTVASLAPGANTSVTLVVTASSTITNSDYGVSAAGGVSASGSQAVVTNVGSGSVVLPGNDTVIQTEFGVVLTIPAGSVNDTLVILPTPMDNPSNPISSGLRFAGQAFSLQAFLNGVLQETYTFSNPVSIRVPYTDADVQGINEETLRLYYWDEDAMVWRNAAGTCTPSSAEQIDPDANIFETAICHLTDFALKGESASQDVFLPLVLK